MTKCITLLASEWKSSKGGLSTINRELAIQFAKLSNTSVSFFVPTFSDEDKIEATKYNVKLVKAEERPGFDPIDWLTFPPKDLAIDFVVGHGVILGKQAQIIRNSHKCKWVQVVHTAPDELAVYKEYSNAISKGEEKQAAELKLCQMADLVVAIGPKLAEFYTALLNSCGKKVHNFTPGVFKQFEGSNVPPTQGKRFRILVFGRGDTEDFKLKGYDIAAQAVAKLVDKTYNLTFVGASKGSQSHVGEELLKHGLLKSQLIVKGYLKNREDLIGHLCASNLVIIPSRTEGFGLTALEALSAGIPFLVSQNSGFGEALQEIPRRSAAAPFIVDSEDPEDWAEAIKVARQKGSEGAFQECQELRALYAEKYNWQAQCVELFRMMNSLINESNGVDNKDQTPVFQPPTSITKWLSLLNPVLPKPPASKRATPVRTNNQETRPKERNSESTESDLVILGCSVSEEIIFAVVQEIERIRPMLNLPLQPPAINLSPILAKRYIEENSLRSCVLVVDGERIKDAYENPLALKDAFEVLLKTATTKVANKVIILVCHSRSMSENDEEMVYQTIYRAVKEKEKGFISWLKDGRLTIDTDVMAQFLNPASAMSYMMLPNSQRGECGSSSEKLYTSVDITKAERVEANQREQRRLENKRRERELQKKLQELEEQRLEKEVTQAAILQREREKEQEEARRRSEESLLLEDELSLRRDELFDYKFGSKVGFHSFQGLKIDDVTQLRIGVIGTTKSGISCFINGCERALRQAERGTAPYGNNGGKQVTTMPQDYLPEMFFHLVDIPGVCNYNFDVVELENILEGKIQPGFDVVKFFRGANKKTELKDLPPCPGFAYRLHGIIFVFNGNCPRFLHGDSSELARSLLPFKRMLYHYGIIPVIVVTYADKLRSKEEREDAFHRAASAFEERRLSHPFMLANYTENDSERNQEKESVILDILDCAVSMAESAVLRMKRNQKTEEIMRQMSAPGGTSASGQIAADSKSEAQCMYMYNTAAQRTEARYRERRRLKNGRRQKQIQERLNILQLKRQEEERRRAGDLEPQQREEEQEERMSIEEEEKRLRLECELCCRRAELLAYNFGSKIGLHNFQGLEINDVTQLRIGVFGQSGAGISSFINGCERVLRQTERGTAPIGGTGLTVTHTLQDYLPELFFHLVDTPGLCPNDSRFVSIFSSFLDGKIQPGSWATPRKIAELKGLSPCPGFAYRLHGVIFVLKGNSPPCVMRQYRNGTFLPLREILDKTGITPVTIITYRDEVETYQELNMVLNEAQETTGSLPMHTFPLDNYTTYDSQRNLEKERTILDILDCAVFLAESAVLRMKRKQKGEEEMTQVLGGATVSGQITPDSA